MTRNEIEIELKIYIQETEAISYRYDKEGNNSNAQYYAGKCIAFEKALEMLNTMSD